MKLKKTLVACLIFALLPLAACGRDGEDASSGVGESSEDLPAYSLAFNPYPSACEHSPDSAALPEASGEGPAAKVYTFGGFSVTLPSEFLPLLADDFELYAVDEANRSGVSLSVASFNDLYAQGLDVGMPVEEYARKVVAAGKIKAVIYDRGEVAYFEYAADIEEARYSYFAYVYKSNAAFYMLQFFCPDGDAAAFRPRFDRIADTVVIKAEY